MRSVSILFLVSGAFATGAWGADLYPEIRVIIREAETAAVNIRYLDDHSNPHTWAARLYAHAGYIEDAARVFTKYSDPSPDLWRARVVYGDLAGAEKSLAPVSDPEQKASALTSLADLLWRMGEPAKARIRFEAARQLTPKIVNLEHRKRMMASIEQGLKYLTEQPPDRLSATPKPWKRFDVEDSAIPLFPITTDGFRDVDSKEITTRASANGEFMTKLYGRMEAGDREGLLRIAESAATPFQKALGMASIEHILIQGGQPEAAEQYARKIPEIDSASALAKAEALSSAAAAWLRAGEASRAQIDFEAAARLVQSVRDLPLGKVSVMISIATAQAKGGMIASSGASLRLARDMARELPVRPKIANDTFRNPAYTIHYRDEAYERILLAAIGAHDLGAAHEIAELWKLAGGKTESAIVQAWFYADRPDEAVAFARKIADTPERVKALLRLAEGLLNQAGAPIF